MARGYSYGRRVNETANSNYMPSYSKEEEVKYLENEMNMLKNQFQSIEARIAELKTEDK
jgi:hypothetical protein